MKGTWETEFGGGQGYGLALDGVARAVWRRREPGLAAGSGAKAGGQDASVPHVLPLDAESQAEEREWRPGTERRSASRRLAERRAKPALPPALPAPPVPVRAPQRALLPSWNIRTLTALAVSVGLGFWGGLQFASSPEAPGPVAMPVPTLQLEKDVDSLGQRGGRDSP